MNSSLRSYLMISIAVFALVALVQVVRALAGFPVQIGSYLIPVVASWLLAIVAGTLAFWGIRLLDAADRCRPIRRWTWRHSAAPANLRACAPSAIY